MLELKKLEKLTAVLDDFENKGADMDNIVLNPNEAQTLEPDNELEEEVLDVQV